MVVVFRTNITDFIDILGKMTKSDVINDVILRRNNFFIKKLLFFWNPHRIYYEIGYNFFNYCLVFWDKKVVKGQFKGKNYENDRNDVFVTSL